MGKTCVIVGASHAAAQCAVSLRQGGWDGIIIMIGDEPDLPYHRPPLSKGFLSGAKSLEDILIRPESVYRDANITLKLDRRVTSINRAAKTVLMDKGERLAYDKLVLATGARVRKLSIEGADDPNVMYLRDAQDIRAIKVAAKDGKRVVIIGGGYIGLETAASLRKQGLQVTVLEAMERILQRVTAPVMSNFYRRIHREEGAVIAEGEVAASISRASDTLTVYTSSGQAYLADFVIVGIGVIPNIELASEASLDVGNGIIVNGFCQTSDPNIYAAGDVTWHHNQIYDRHIRLESVPNATEQAKTCAGHINGSEKTYNSLPWFWSDQYDLKLQIAGLSEGYDNIVMRGDPEGSRQCAAFYFKGEQFLAVDAVNDPRAFMMSKMVLTKGQSLDKAILADEDSDLKMAIKPS